MAKQTQQYGLWDLGRGSRFYSIERYCILWQCEPDEAMNTMRRLGVPILKKGKMRLVNHNVVVMALNAVSWIGKKDFDLDEDQIDPNEEIDYEEILSWLLLSKRLDGLDPDSKLVRRTQKAMHAYRIHRNALLEAAKLEAETQKLLPPIPPHVPMRITDEEALN